MATKLTVILFFLYFTNIEGATRDGYKYYPKIQGWLKLSEPTDWQTARMNCHDEDAILAAPWSTTFETTLVEILNNEASSAIYVGVHEDFPEGVFKYINGKQVLSRDPLDIEELERCVVIYANGSREQVDCRLSFPYVCHAPATAPAVDCGDEALAFTCAEYELDERTGHCYKFHAQAEAWNDAHRVCQNEGAHLAVINSDTEAQVLVELFRQYPYEKLNGTNSAWGVMAVGFYYWKDADTYITIHGQTLDQAGYSNWSYGQPSSRGISKELGGGMFRTGLLDDVDKSYKVPFVCEKTPIPIKKELYLDTSVLR